jgi:tRNA nucleotidyltransferase (CCA-adding enzyme)
MILNEVPSDWDLFTNASGDEILAVFPNGKIIGGEERREKILTVIVDGVEVSQYRRNGDRTETGVSLMAHLSTCDFTINAIACDIHRNIIDPHKGVVALHKLHLECVGDPYDRFEEDKLRLLRAIRFIVKYRMSVEKQLTHVIRTMDISDLPVERFRDELLKILRYPDGLITLMSTGSVFGVIPELQKTRYLDGGDHHDESVGLHLQLAQNRACELTANPVLIFACAMHDIGKTETVVYSEDCRTTFYGHEKVGAKMLVDIMGRMRFSNTDIKYATTLVAEHMYRTLDGEKTNRSLVRHFKRLEDAGISIEDYMVLWYCDNQANRKNPRTKFVDFNDIFEAVIQGDLTNERSVLMHHLKKTTGKIQ